jgi:hypothetical protein
MSNLDNASLNMKDQFFLHRRWGRQEGNETRPVKISRGLSQVLFVLGTWLPSYLSSDSREGQWGEGQTWTFAYLCFYFSSEAWAPMRHDYNWMKKCAYKVSSNTFWFPSALHILKMVVAFLFKLRNCKNYEPIWIWKAVSWIEWHPLFLYGCPLYVSIHTVSIITNPGRDYLFPWEEK